MNDLYEKLINEGVLSWLADDSCAENGEFLIRLVVKECLSQMTDHLDKQRIIKHFGLEA